MTSLPPVVVQPSVLAGTTVLIPTGLNHHLFIAVYDSKWLSGHEKVLLVPLESVRPKHDPSCLLSPPAHPFLTGPTFVGYGHARSEFCNHVMACLAAGTYGGSHPAVSATVLAQIQAGYASTRHAPRFIRADWP